MKKKHSGRVLAFALCIAILLLVPQTISRVVYPRKYSDAVERYSKAYGVPTSIIYAVIKTESNFDPRAVSSAGAIGLMQIMPSTFAWLMALLGETHETVALYDPDINIRYGTYFLRYLYDYYGRYDTAFAAYNAGMGNVSRWLDSAEHSLDGRLTDIPFPETADYVRLVTRRALRYEKIYKLKG